MPLALLYLALIVYASLYPFGPWRIPGVSPLAFLGLPWPRWWTWFDLVINLVGYLPLGALVFGAWVRGGHGVRTGIGVALLVGAGMSFGMELLQNFIPRRVASNIDLGVNAAGALVGALLGAGMHLLGGIERWQSARDRWFIRRSAGGLALLLLWPVGLLFPLPVPFGQGQVLGLVQEWAVEWVAGTPVEAWLDDWSEADIDAQIGIDRPGLSPAGEFAAISLGLLAPCLVAFAVARAGWGRLVLVFGALALGCLTTTLSTALNFNPQHMLAWSTPRAVAALLVAVLLAALLSRAPRRAAAGLGLMALTALVLLVTRAPADPYFAESLQLWEQGRFIRFHGAAQWVGWLWPYAAIVYLLGRLAAREEPPRIGS